MAALELGFFSIPVLNMESAKSFYGPVMGWEFNDRDPSFSYIFGNGNMLGALELATEKFKPSESGPLVYFRTDFMEPTLKKVSVNGGSTLEKLDMEGGARGYTAKVSDPFKNTIGFWAPEEQQR